MLQVKKLLLSALILSLPASAIAHAEGAGEETIQPTSGYTVSAGEVEALPSPIDSVSKEVEKRIVVKMDEKEILVTANGETEQQTLAIAPKYSADFYPMIPLRSILEILGCEVLWIPEGQKVLLLYEEKMVLLTLNSNVAIVNGKKVTLPTKVRSENGNSYLPLAFMPNLDFKAYFDDGTKTGSITKLAANE
jgi:hypothetical protein